MSKKTESLESTKRLMGALVRMKPKPHEELKKKKRVTVKKDSKGRDKA